MPLAYGQMDDCYAHIVVSAIICLAVPSIFLLRQNMRMERSSAKRTGNCGNILERIGGRTGARGCCQT